MPPSSGHDKADAALSAEQAAGAPAELRGRLHSWRHPAVLSAAGLSVAAGFAQFSVTAALPDVAAAFGEIRPDDASIAAQAGLAATTLGLGLAVIRFASLGALPLSALADRAGRRRVVLTCAALGLLFTVAAAFSPGFWWFVAIAAVGRPLLSTTNAVAGVIAAEETRTRDRAYALALITAGYGIGAGTAALLRGIIGEALGFRELFGLAVVFLVAVPLLGRMLEEPARFNRVRALGAARRWSLDGIPRSGLLGGRFRIMALTTLAIAFLTGPVNTFLFLFGENVLHMTRATTALAVIAAAPIGLLGLLSGRALADRLGRVPSAAGAHALMAIAGVITYSGTPTGLIAGYLATIYAASAYAPAQGALAAELFPTSMRATVAGAITAVNVIGAVLGLVGFGMLTDRFDSFGMAAIGIAAPVLLIAPLYLRLPETRHLELEQSAPEEISPA
ncbi:MAG: MFS transporter [Nitriliruptorales bacterium]|nr:MFS transporter [Nitriliruptorales bacterium]